MAELNTVSEENLVKLGAKIKQARLDKNLTTRTLSELSETISSTEINLLENAKRKSPNPIVIKKIAEILGLDYMELFKIIGYVNRVESNLEIPSEFQYIPIYKSISAGYGSVESEIEEFMALPKLPGLRGDIFAFRVKGDSMEPSIENKSIVLIKKIPEVANKKIGAFILNGEAIIKRYFCVEGRVFLRSDNSSMYPDIQVRPSDELVIVGQYVGGFNLNGE